MINTETTVESIDKCTTKITSNNSIQTSGKRSTTTTKKSRGEDSSIPKKHLKEASKNEKQGNSPNNTKTGRSILTPSHKTFDKELLSLGEIKDVPAVTDATPIHMNQKKTPLEQQAEQVWEPPKKIQVQEEREKWVHLLQNLAQQNGWTENSNQKSSANEHVSFYTIIFGGHWVFSLTVVTSGCFQVEWVTTWCFQVEWVTTWCFQVEWVTSGCYQVEWATSGCFQIEWVTSGCFHVEWAISGCFQVEWVTSGCFQLQWVTSGCFQFE